VLGISLQLIQGSIQHHFTCLSRDEKRLEHEYNPIRIMIKQNRNKNKDFRIILGGDNGNGKSALLCRFGEDLNPKTFITTPEYAVDNQIHLLARPWLHASRKILNEYDVNGMDEPVQSGGNHREFMSQTNMVLTKTVSTVRYKKNIIPVCIPFIDQLDLDLQKLCQVYAHCYDQGHAEVFKIINPKFGGDPWFEKIIDEMTWIMPNQKLWNLYNIKKERIQDEQYGRYEEQLDKRMKDERNDDDLYRELKTKLSSTDMINPKNSRISIPMLTSELEVGRDKAERLRAKYEKEIGFKPM